MAGLTTIQRATAENVFLTLVESSERPGRDDLLRACGYDAAVCDEVEGLLRGHDASEALFAVDDPADDGAALLPETIGPYRIVRIAGTGGMGEVYEAVRQGDFEQRVAIKLILDRGRRSDRRERFLSERRILARLEHANIARMIDGGWADEGPYLVMEYVDGIPIDRYCDDRTMSIDERLGLFTAVCQAVSHAHRHLVVHRDIKPGNIFVTADGRVKLLDFGIAKLLDDAAGTKSGSLTLTDQRLMTPAYASPEQHEGSAITTVSDVFQLGVVLHELLAGTRPPLERGSVSRQASDRMDHVYDRLSGEERAGIAARRRSTPEGVRRRLGSDLRHIVSRCLRQDPSSRYRSVELLLEDIERYRAGHPVTAREGATWYRFVKLVGRHRLSAAVAAVLVLAISTFGAYATVQSARLRAEQTRTETALRRAQLVTDFMADLFAAASPERTGGREMTVREVLELGALRMQNDTAFAGDPLQRAAFLNAIGRAFSSLGESGRGVAIMEEAHRLRQETGSEAPLDLAESLNDLGASRLREGRVRDADTLLARAVRLNAANGGNDRSLGIAAANLAVARTQLGEHQSADSLFSRAIELLLPSLGQSHAYVVGIRNQHALLLREMGDLAGAERMLNEVIQSTGKGMDSAALGMSYGNLGTILVGLGRYSAADTALSEAERLTEQVFGRDHPRMASILVSRASAINELGRPEEAERMLLSALEIRKTRFGANSALTAVVLNNLAALWQDRDDADRAAPYFRQAIEAAENAPEPDFDLLFRLRTNLVFNDMARGDTLAGRDDLESVLAIGVERAEVSPAYRIDYWWASAELARFDRNFARADSFAVTGIEHARVVHGSNHPRVLRLQILRARIQHELGNFELARALVEDAFPRLEEALGADHPGVIRDRQIRDRLRRGR